jgi:hypothetical protein
MTQLTETLSEQQFETLYIEEMNAMIEQEQYEQEHDNFIETQSNHSSNEDYESDFADIETDSESEFEYEIENESIFLTELINNNPENDYGFFIIDTRDGIDFEFNYLDLDDRDELIECFGEEDIYDSDYVYNIHEFLENTYSYADVLSYRFANQFITINNHASYFNVICQCIKFRNHDIFEEVEEEIKNRECKKAQKNAFKNSVEEELLQKALHPNRLNALIQKYGFEGMCETVM